VIPAPFEYARAGSVDEAISLLGSNDDAKVIAGGHSLLPLMRLRFARPALLVDIDRLGDLEYVRDGGDHIEIGALTRMAEVANDPLLKASSPLMAYTAGLVGDPQVRHRGTLGGSVAHGDPASDPPTTLVALGAPTAIGPSRRRTSSRASSRPTWGRATCSPRSAFRRPDRRGGRTRSSIAARSTGPSWASRRS
jgi:carbon-monoxide dehydrogenase medium subunit